MEFIETIAKSVPEFLFAIVIFWLCQRNADAQRTAYQDQITELYGMLKVMLTAVSRSLDIMEEKSKQN